MNFCPRLYNRLIAIAHFLHRRNLKIFCFGRFLPRKVRRIKCDTPPFSLSRSLARSLGLCFPHSLASVACSLDLARSRSLLHRWRFPLCDVTSTFFFKGRWLDIRKYLLPIPRYIRWACSYKNHRVYRLHSSSELVLD